MKFQDVLLLFLLAAMWGASFLFIRVAVPIMRPFPLVASRVVIGGSLLLIYAIIIKQTPDWRTHWRKFLVIGIFNNALPFTLISAAQLNMTASLAALLNSTAPLFSAVIAAIWIHDKLTAPKLIGLFFGIIGVGIVVGWRPEPISTTLFIGIIFVLLASLSYGFAGVFIKSSFKGVPPLSIAIGQLLSAAIIIMPLAIANPPTTSLTPTIIGAMLGLAVVSTSVAYIIYFHLIESAGPTNAVSVTLLVPFFSSLWGAIFLNERLLLNEFLGFLVILVGLVLVTGLWKRVFTVHTKPKIA